MDENTNNVENNEVNNSNMNQNNQPVDSKFSIAALVCGILAVVFCCIWYVSVILGIIAIVLGIIGL